MRFAMILVLAFAGAPALVARAAEDERPADLNCEIGPLQKTYGQTAWLVYACNDSRSIVVVADKDNPALPFYFIFYVKPAGDMQLHGEGNGQKWATQAAFDELAVLTQTDVAKLVAEAKAMQTGGSVR